MISFFWLSSADKVTTETNIFVLLIVKIVLWGHTSVLSLPAGAKTQHYVHLSFNSTLQLINGISSDRQKLLRFFDDTEVVIFFRIPVILFGAGWATVFGNNLALQWIGMTRSESSAPFIVVPSIFVILLMNGAQFLSATLAAAFSVIVKSPLTKM